MHIERPYFSIITPVKNGAKHIKRYLYGLENQTFRNWEAIIIDDCSIDDSFEILKSETLKDKRLKIFINSKLKRINSPYESRNLGLEKANGKFICFLDIDDYWLSNKLERQYQITKKNEKINLLFSSYYRFHEKNNKYFLRKPFLPFGIKNAIKYFNPIPLLDSCVRLSSIKKLRFEPIYHEDHVFWKKLVKSISKDSIYIDSIPNSIYSVSNDSLSGSKIKVIKWIWNIYFQENRNYLIAYIKLFFRAFIQILIYLMDREVYRRDLNKN